MRLRIELEMDDRGLAGLQRAAIGRREIRGLLDHSAIAAERRGVGGEVRIAQLGRDHAARIFALLVHADGAVHAVVGDHAMIGTLYCTAVANSCPFIRKSPSPAMHTTGRCGSMIFIATAAGTP